MSFGGGVPWMSAELAPELRGTVGRRRRSYDDARREDGYNCERPIPISAVRVADDLNGNPLDMSDEFVDE